MDGVHVAARARVDADVRALLGREAGEHAVVEVDEVLEHVLAGPGVARVVLVRQPPLGEVDRDAHRAGVEAAADVLLALVDEVVEELLARVALDLALERVEQHQHRRGDDGLLDRLGGDRAVLLDELRRVGLVAERAAGQPRQLAVVAVVEDREELAVAGEVVGQAGAGERVGDRVGGEARLALLAVGDDRLAGLLQAPDRVLGRLVLLGLQRGEVDLAVVVGLAKASWSFMGLGREPTSSVGIDMSGPPGGGGVGRRGAATCWERPTRRRRRRARGRRATGMQARERPWAATATRRAAPGAGVHRRRPVLVGHRTARPGRRHRSPLPIPASTGAVGRGETDRSPSGRSLVANSTKSRRPPRRAAPGASGPGGAGTLPPREAVNPPTTVTRDARTRILEAAYELFSRRGMRAVGIDAIIERAGVAKDDALPALRSKDELVLAFLERREAALDQGWLQAEVERARDDPGERLLAIFDVFDGWFHARGLRGLLVHQRAAGDRRRRAARVGRPAPITSAGIRAFRRGSRAGRRRDPDALRAQVAHPHEGLDRRRRRGRRRRRAPRAGRRPGCCWSRRCRRPRRA